MGFVNNLLFGNDSRNKIKVAEETGSFSVLMLVMLDKQLQFEEEIKNLQDEYVNVVD